MAPEVVVKVLQALDEQGILSETAYPGKKLINITEEMAAVNLEKVDFTGRSATVQVTVLSPVSMGGGACEVAAMQVGRILERLGAMCVQEECRFNSYANAFYVRLLGTFRGAAVMESWSAVSDFEVEVGGVVLPNAVSFKAEQAVDEVTGTPLNTAVWTFRIVEEFGRGQSPVPAAAEPFTVKVSRSSGVETYSQCTWIACQVENTGTGLRQIRSGVAKSRSEIIIE